MQRKPKKRKIPQKEKTTITAKELRHVTKGKDLPPGGHYRKIGTNWELP